MPVPFRPRPNFRLALHHYIPYVAVGDTTPLYYPADAESAVRRGDRTRPGPPRFQHQLVCRPLARRCCAARIQPKRGRIRAMSSLPRWERRRRSCQDRAVGRGLRRIASCGGEVDESCGYPDEFIQMGHVAFHGQFSELRLLNNGSQTLRLPELRSLSKWPVWPLFLARAPAVDHVVYYLACQVVRIQGRLGSTVGVRAGQCLKGSNSGIMPLSHISHAVPASAIGRPKRGARLSPDGVSMAPWTSPRSTTTANGSLPYGGVEHRRGSQEKH